MDAVKIAKEVILQEAAGLSLLAQELDDSFERAIRLLENCSGRIIVSGMGKSGHIARKISATLSSTGAPSCFLHPAEASHGDLGMIGSNDVIIVLSNSGETPEISDLVAFCCRSGIPIVGVTSKRSSSLARASSIQIIMPNYAEACGIGVVPTTSTTMMLALGDAIGITLMRRRRFSAVDFRSYHPGGKLGARLATVDDVMVPLPDLPLVTSGALMSDAIITMSEKGFGILGVVDGEELVGVITDGDLRRNIDGLLGRIAGDVMTKSPLRVCAGSLAVEAISIMQRERVGAIFVVEDINSMRLVGMIQIKDCLRLGVI